MNTNTRIVMDISGTEALGWKVSHTYFAYRNALEAWFDTKLTGTKVPHGCLMSWIFISGNEGCIPSDIVRTIGFSKSTVSSQIQHLEKLGLIERVASDNDGRSVILNLTEKGKKLSVSTLEDMREFEKLIEEHRDTDDWSVIFENLSKFEGSVDKVKPKA